MVPGMTAVAAPTRVFFFVWHAILALWLGHYHHYYCANAMPVTMKSSWSSSTKMLFPFVHPSIADVLECRQDASSCSTAAAATTTTRKPRLLDTKLLRIQEWPSTSAAAPSQSSPTSKEMPSWQKESLVQLALECDDFVFGQHGLDDETLFSNNKEDDEDLIGIRQMISWGRASDDSWKQEDSHNGNSTTSSHHHHHHHQPTTSSSATLVLAALLGLNRLEAAIRHAATGHATAAGRAPLLKSMIDTLHQQQQQQQAVNHSGPTAEVLQALLLPTPGLNLRNLLWHGFLASLPRPWLALILVLIVILERDYPAAAAALKPLSSSVDQAAVITKLPNLRQYAEFGPLLARGQALLLKGDLLYSIDTSWISQGTLDSNNRLNNDTLSSKDDTGSHVQWWELVTHWMETRQYPLCTCILVTCLIEHGLRQLWCEVNDRRDDAMANPGVFYVTLDGHGQRHQHDVMLYPYVGDDDNGKDDSIRNALVERLGGPTMALLADLYCSPCGGPNLRASLAHGLWDAFLQAELAATCSSHPHSDAEQEEVWDLVKILLALMDEIGTTVSTTTTGPMTKSQSLLYRPLFSYTAATCRHLDSAMNELHVLELPLTTASGQERLRSAKAAVHLSLEPIRSLQLSLESLDERAMALKRICGYPSTTRTHTSPTTRMPWTSDDVFREHETNRVLASVGAARTLLLEVAEATATFRASLEEALGEAPDGASSRQRKQRLRTIAASELATIVYTFAAVTAILLLEHDLRTTGWCAGAPSGGGLDPQEGEDPSGIKQRAVLLQAVKRSRMTLSTVSNFIGANTDRAIKAAKEYSQGKAIQAIVAALKKK